MKIFKSLSCVIIFIISIFSASPMIIENQIPDYDIYEDFADKIENVIDLYFLNLSKIDRNILKIIIYTCLDTIDYLGIDVSEEEIQLYESLKEVSLIKNHLLKCCRKVSFLPSIYHISHILNEAPNNINLKQMNKCCWIVSSAILGSKINNKEIYGD